MEMTMRWYGSKFDTVTLKQIRQIPGVTGVITTLYDTTPGEVWTSEAIRALKAEYAGWPAYLRHRKRQCLRLYQGWGQRPGPVYRQLHQDSGESGQGGYSPGVL